MSRSFWLNHKTYMPHVLPFSCKTTASKTLFLQPPWWTGTLTRWPCRTSRLGRCGSSYVAAGWALTGATAWPRRLSTLRRTTRSPALGWGVTNFFFFFHFRKKKKENTPGANAVWLQWFSTCFSPSGIFSRPGRLPASGTNTSGCPSWILPLAVRSLGPRGSPAAWACSSAPWPSTLPSGTFPSIRPRPYSFHWVICLKLYFKTSQHLIFFHHLLSPWSPPDLYLKIYTYMYTHIHIIQWKSQHAKCYRLILLSFVSSPPSQGHYRLHGRRSWWASRVAFSCFQSTSSSSPSFEASDLGLF